MFPGDNIAAISTPPGRGGIGVLRVSGPGALETAAAIFRSESESPIEPSRARFGRLVDPATADCFDEAILTYFKAPHSYTGEDVVELSCHGSPVILARALKLIIQRGVRVAQPGEFTFRAFLNKRIDLAQAQAVRDLVNAQTVYQARVAARQLEGALSKRLAPIQESLIEVIVHLESSVEFVEEDISPDAVADLAAKLDRAIERLEETASSFSFGRYLKEGFDLAIVGRPNVGKSSIFNRLIGTDRAIVTELPGTTRDALYESTSISGVPVRLIDTAGIRETRDVVESLGIGRSRTAIADADISVLVLDASEALTDDDIQLLDQVPRERRVLVYNKVDLLGDAQAGFLEPAGLEVIPISALTGQGFERLIETIFGNLAGDSAPEMEDLVVTDARQEAALRMAIEHLRGALSAIQEAESEEVVLLKLHGALAAIGEVTGETLADDILGQIFSTFCIGK
jgi:tRNA modification GTPase